MNLKLNIYCLSICIQQKESHGEEEKESREVEWEMRIWRRSLQTRHAVDYCAILKIKRKVGERRVAQR